MKDLFDSIGIYYDLIYKNKNYVNEVEFIINTLSECGINGKLILDFGCGTGKHAIQFVEKGYNLDGVERSNTLISFIQKINGFNFYKGDIRNIKLEKKYDGILSLFHVMSYQTKNEDLKSVFKNANFHLKPNGFFLFDFWYTPAVKYQLPEVRVQRFGNKKNNIFRIAEPKIFIDKNIVDVKYTIFVEDIEKNQIQKFEEIHPMRHFCLEEIDAIGKSFGFKMIKNGEWLTNKTPSKESWGVYVIFKKL